MSDRHPHYDGCASCNNLAAFNSFVQFVLLMAIPFVNPTRAIALAIVMLSCELAQLPALRQPIAKQSERL